MRTLPAALTLAKNLMASSSPWVPVLDITLVDSTAIHLVKNIDDITIGGQVYTAMPMDFDNNLETVLGELPTSTLKICNVGRALVPYLEEQNGCADATVVLRFINAGLLGEDYTALSLSFSVIETNSDNYWVYFKLGGAKLLSQKFPSMRYLSGYCNWTFKSVECAYAGADVACARTLDACRAKTNSPRFGGFPGITSGGIRVV